LRFSIYIFFFFGAEAKINQKGKWGEVLSSSYTTTDTSELWCPSRKRDHSSYADRGAFHCYTTHNCGKTGEKEKEIWPYISNTQTK